MIIPVILSGGSGTRLWPLSTSEKPKQFLSLVTDRTLFQETLLRLAGLPNLADPIVVCNEAHRFLVAEQMREIDIRAQAIVLEPEGRNTAPAIAVAARLAQKASGPDANPILLVLPADQVVGDGAAFRAAVERAVRAAESGRLVTFGIVPTHPETGYGYIERGAEEGGWMPVVRFVEKPDLATAERYVAAGNFLWNSGMFVFGASEVLAELGRHVPEIAAACDRAAADASVDQDFTRLGAGFLESPADSIDYAVMEKTDRAAVVPLAAQWSDVGSWGALYEVMERDGDGNVLRGDTVALDVRNCLVMPGLRKIALLGVDDVVVVDAGTALLIMARSRSQDVKSLLRLLQANTH